jgi:Ca2+-transporting ATPase
MDGENWYNLSTQEVLDRLDTTTNGLTTNKAKLLLAKYGPNELEKYKGITPLEIFFNQFKNVLVAVLFITTIISVLAGEMIDATLILVFIFILVVIGFVQEYKAEKSLEALRKLITPKAKVIRNGEEIEIPAKELVPGDIVLLDVGDRVPADIRLLETINLEVDESNLTGESIPVKKSVGEIKEEVLLAERHNMVFAGTVVTGGRCKGVVVATGMGTEMGKIAKVVQIEERETPLKIQLSQLSILMAIVVAVISSVVFLVGVYKGEQITKVFLAAVALAVSAIPEALPVIVTVTLAIGVHEMVKRNSIIRKLPAVETLGSTTVICCDKTGTLTKNEMTVQEVYTNKLIHVSGIGYKPEGKFFTDNKEIDVEKDEHLILLLKAGSLCNNATLNSDIFGNWWVVGSPTEGALLTLAEKGGLKGLKHKYPFVTEIPFDPKRKVMTTIHEENEEYVAYVKGAPEEILKRVKLPKSDKDKILEISDGMASRGLRVLAFAHKKLPKNPDILTAEHAERDLTFIGLVGMKDPPRPEAKESIKLCKKAGIKVVIITGDHKLTAMHVASELGIDTNMVLTGDELDKLSDEEFEKIVEDVSIYTRTSPEHKLRIVKALQKKGHIVAMTGDGVNDAPALKRADIGVAMGLKGTEVAKEVSDMVLVDDNFTSIVSAVEEGRKIYDNIKKSVLYLFSTAVGEVLLILTGVLAGLPLPFLAVQILWINIVTEGIPAIGLAFERSEPDVMRRKPRNPKEELLTGELIYRMLGLGILMAVGSLFLYLWYYQDILKARTMAFNTLVMFELFNILNCRSLRHSSLEIGFFSNKALLIVVLISFLLQVAVIESMVLSSAFKIVSLTLSEWIITILFGSTIFLAGELRKSTPLLRHLPF